MQLNAKGCQRPDSVQNVEISLKFSEKKIKLENMIIFLLSFQYDTVSFRDLDRR
jgi:hypothetical protein